MKRIYAATIVAFSIVFHAVAPKIFGPPVMRDGWVAGLKILACASRKHFDDYRGLQVTSAWENRGDVVTPRAR